MCFSKPEMPKEDPAAKAAREAELRAQLERTRKLKEDQYEKRRGQLSGSGVRSLITGSSGAGYGRNFF